MKLSTRFDNATILRGNEPLTDEQLFRVAPSVFAEAPHESRSQRYTYIPTIQVINGLRKEGFKPFMAVQSRSRIEGKENYTKHMLRLRQADQINGEEAKEIVLINSHDGTSSYQLLAGIFRFVCHNGMVCGDTVQDLRIRHKGDIVNDVIEAAYEIVNRFDKVEESIEEMKTTKLLLSEAKAFAEVAIDYKYGDAESSPINPEDLLKTRRIEDTSNNVWTTFNRIQENLIKGKQRGRTKTGRRTTTREVKSIDNNVKLNKALWSIAEKMAEIKNIK